MNQNDTLLKGRITELKCLTYFLQQGYIISVPEVPCRYDFIIDVKNHLYKIQVKSCRLSNENDYIVFNTSSLTHNTEGYKKRIYTEDDIDFFCTNFNNEFYLIPLKDCGSKEKRLRLLPTKNGQEKNISFAKNYKAKDILSKL